MPRIPLRSSRKRQTRLAFTPLPSSSPAPSDHSPMSSKRTAAVGKGILSMPPQKRRKVVQHLGASAEDKALPGSFESPVKGSNIAVVIYTPQKPRMDERATLGALPTPQTSSQYDAADKGAPSAVTVNGTKTTSDTDSDIQILPSPARGRKQKTEKSSHRQDTVKVTSSEQSQRGTRSHLLGRKTPQPRILGTDQELGHDLSRVPAGANLESTLRVLKSGRNSPLVIRDGSGDAGKVIDISSDNGSDSERSIFASPPRRLRDIFTGDMITPKQARPCKQDAGSSRRFLLGGNTGSAPVSTSKALPLSRAKKLPSASIPTRTPLKASASAGHKLTTTEGDDSDEIVISPVKRVKLQQSGSRPAAPTTTDSSHETDSDEESQPLITPTRKRRYSMPKPLASQQDLEDLEEDLEVLHESNLEARRTRTRSTPAKKEKAKRRLEILRQRRAGEKVTTVSSSSDGEQGPKRGIYDSDSEELSLSDNGDESPLEEGNVSGIEAIRETLRSDRRDEYDADFVDDGEEDTIGAPLGLEDIPIEFTRHAHKRLVEHFKDAIEWMVHNKLNPAFARDDPLYRVAFRRLDDEVKGFTASKFVSAAWNPEFIRALQSRPVFYEMELPIAERNKCDACNRSGHPTKFQVQFGGKSYHRENLEDVSEASDDDSDEDDARSRDSQGNSIPSTEVQYFVGRFCKANAETAHSLIHWRYHLNQWVIEHLKEENHFSAEKVVQRESWAVKRRQKYANGVVDAMEEAGEIGSLFKDFKTNLDSARNAKPNRYKER
ncbi:MAG: hypothetical protein M1812_004287 [Candelaria pacifica]|nr:MAG: hypothetical protein M1812_004287 [Candelaria pacifica]